MYVEYHDKVSEPGGWVIIFHLFLLKVSISPVSLGPSMLDLV